MKYVLLALTTICIIGACKKVTTPDTTAEKLAGKDSPPNSWEPTSLAITYFDAQGGDSDMVYKWEKKKNDDPHKGDDTRPECIKDDKIQFKYKTNDGDYLTGGNKCASSETDDIAFKWGLSNDDKNMYIYGLYSLLGTDANGYLNSFADDKFVFVYPGRTQDANHNDISVKYTMTFTKK